MYKKRGLVTVACILSLFSLSLFFQLFSQLFSDASDINNHRVASLLELSVNPSAADGVPRTPGSYLAANYF